MQDIPKTEILAEVRASAGRRIMGIGSLALMGVLLIYLAFTRSPELGWQLFLIGIGGAALWLADGLRRATAHRLVLTGEALRDSSGELLAAVDDIQSVDRGFFAFKPSNGFLLTTKSPGARVWRPGLWWRFGRRIGVGGMAPGRQTKNMSEIIAVIVARRDL